MSQVRLQLEKLKEAEEKAQTTILAIQQEIDESAKQMATQNAKLQKQKQELEIGKKLAFKSLEEKHRKEIVQLEEKYQKEIAELEAKEWERNVNFAKEMTSLKEQLKEENSTFLDYLFPTVTLWKNVCVEANFGDNPAKPFKYNIEKCPGLVLE